MGYWTNEKRAEAIAATRRICDFLEANPEFSMPSSFSGGHLVQVGDEIEDKGDDAMRAWFLKNAELLGKDVRLSQDDSYFTLSRDFGGVYLSLMMHHTYLCDKRTEVVSRSVEEKSVVLKCPDEIKALGFTDPGIIKPDSWERLREDEE